MNKAAARFQLEALTSVRGLAAWWVVLYHTRSVLKPYLTDPIYAFVANGDLAVDMFFVLSGFVIYLNYGNKVRSSWFAVGDFLYRRLARIYPLHLATMIAFLGYVAALEFAGRNTQYEAGYFIQSLLLVQNWGFGTTISWNVPAWSISTEMFAYLTFPLLVVLMRPDRWPAWLLVAVCVGLGLGLHAYFSAFGYTYTGSIAETGLVRCVVQFTMGIFVCILYQRAPSANWLPVSLIALAALLITARVADRSAPVIPLIWMTLILGLALWHRHNPLDWRPFVWLGDISYATYLCHFLAFIVFKQLFVAEGENTPLAYVLAFYAAILAVSHLLYRYLEKPAQRSMLAWRSRRLTASTQ